MTKVVPILCGNTNIHSQQNIMFTELHPITTDEATKAQPDLLDGAHIHELDKAVRDNSRIRPIIIPSKHRNVPVANNFFLEAKGPRGNAAVMQYQACYNGAYGARAIHSLQKYGGEEPVYEGNARSFSSTYHAGTGTLQLYSHRVTAPAIPGGQPKYHMNQLNSYALTGNHQTFVEGATAYRNLRDLAKQHRDTFIQVANARARGDIPPTEQDTLASTLSTMGHQPAPGMQ